MQAIDTELSHLAQQIDEARGAAITLARKRTELERSRDEFRRSGYERRGGGFTNNELVGDVIGGIIGGVLSSRELGDALRSGYRQGGSRPSFPTRPGGSVFGGGGSSSGSSGASRPGEAFHPITPGRNLSADVVKRRRHNRVSTRTPAS